MLENRQSKSPEKKISAITLSNWMTAKRYSLDEIKNLFETYLYACSAPIDAAKLKTQQMILNCLFMKEFSPIGWDSRFKYQSFFVIEEFERLLRDVPAPLEVRTNFYKNYPIRTTPSAQIKYEFITRLVSLQRNHQNHLLTSQGEKKENEIEKLKILKEIKVMFLIDYFGLLPEMSPEKRPKAFVSEKSLFAQFVKDVKEEYEDIRLEEAKHGQFTIEDAKKLAEVYVKTLDDYSVNPDEGPRHQIIKEMLAQQFKSGEPPPTDFIVFFREVFTNIVFSHDQADRFETDYKNVLKILQSSDPDLYHQCLHYDQFALKAIELEEIFHTRIQKHGGEQKKREQEKLWVLRRLKQILSSGHLEELAGLTKHVYTKGLSTSLLTPTNSVATLVTECHRVLGTASFSEPTQVKQQEKLERVHFTLFKRQQRKDEADFLLQASRQKQDNSYHP